MNACDFDLSSFFAKNLSVCGSGQTMFLPRCWFLNEVSPLFVCTSANKDLCLCANPEEVNHATINVCIAFFTHLVAYWSGDSPDHMYRPLGDNIQWGNIYLSLELLLQFYLIIASLCSSMKTINNRKSIWKIFFLGRICFFSLIFKLALILNY